MSEYKSTRNRNNNDSEDQNREENQSFASTRKEEKEKERDSSKKLAKTAAKGVATYYAGPVGGKAVDKIANTKAGDAILNKGGEALNRIPGVKKAAKKLDDSGLIDKADKSIDLIGAAGGGGAPDTVPHNNVKAGSEGTDKIGGSSSNNEGGSSFLNNSNNPKNNENDSDSNDKENTVLGGKIKIPMVVKIAGLTLAPVLLLFIIIMIVTSTIGGAINNFTDAIGLSKLLGLPSGDYTSETISEDAKRLYSRIEDVVKESEKKGKIVDPLKLLAVFSIANYYNSDYDYNYMNTSRLTKIADAMFIYDKETKEYYYSEDSFRNKLKNEIFYELFPKKSEGTREKYTDEVFEYITKYYEMIEYNPATYCSPTSTCTYSSNGVYIYGKGNIIQNINFSNIKVRLMESGVADNHDYGGTFGKPLEGEELVDFEKYILGVAYAEIGTNAPDEAIKAQMIASRSYILARPTDMGDWRTITKEGDNWIIQVASSTQDQVYCDPDRGCSSNDGQWGMIHSGQDYNTGYSKPPLAANSRLRTLANETAGEVLTNSQGYIIYSGFKQQEQDQMIQLANNGYNYKQILMQIYNSSTNPYGASDIQKMTCTNINSMCTNAVTGDFASWKQFQGPWINVAMGGSGKTIRQIGCLATSIAMQIARSGVPTNIQGEFNPGTFVEFLNSHGGFDGGGNLIWNGVTTAAPSFRFNSRNYVTGQSREQKYNTLVNLLNQGCYTVAEVKGNTGQHWVAIASAQNGEVSMMDPGSNSTNLWAQYNWNNTSQFVCFKIG